MSDRHPDHIKVGHSVTMCSLEFLGRGFGITNDQALELLQDAQVPSVRFGDNPKRYFNLFSLEAVLFEILLPKLYQDANPRLVRFLQMTAGLEHVGLDKTELEKRLLRWAKRFRTKLKRRRGVPRKS